MEGPQGHRGRVKERYMAEGMDHFQPHEVLEYLLMFALPRVDTKPIARELLRAFGSIWRVFEAAPEDLCKVKGVGEHTALLISSLPAFMRRYQLDRFGPKPSLESRDRARDYCAALMSGKRYEVSMVLLLNSSYQLLHAAEISQGTIDQVSIYPRVVVELALRHQAACAIVVHNHPGGTLMPSLSDVQVTATIRASLAAIDVRLLDHLIVARGEALSVTRDDEASALRPSGGRAKPPWAQDEESAAEQK